MFDHSGVVANPILGVAPRVQMQQETFGNYAKVARRHSLANPGAFENSRQNGGT
jgi:hypothetical protein